MKIITGKSCPNLARNIVKHLDTKHIDAKLVDCEIREFANTERCPKINENIRGEDIVIIQTGVADENGSINDYLLETFLLIAACKRSSASSITVVLPCFPYARQDKKDDSRVPISAKDLVADGLTAMGATRVISVDLHSGQIQGFFSIPMDNLYAVRLFSDYIKDELVNAIQNHNPINSFVLVSPDGGGAKRIRSYSTWTGIDYVIMDKQRDYSTPNKVDKSIIIGNTDLLRSKIAIVIDDMIDTGGTIIKAIEALRPYQVKTVILMFTHGILSNNAIDKIMNSDLVDRIVVTDTVPQEKHCSRYPKLHVVSVAPLLAQAIQCTFNGRSMSAMFTPPSG